MKKKWFKIVSGTRAIQIATTKKYTIWMNNCRVSLLAYEIKSNVDLIHIMQLVTKNYSYSKWNTVFVSQQSHFKTQPQNLFTIQPSRWILHLKLKNLLLVHNLLAVLGLYQALVRIGYRELLKMSNS